MREGNALSCFPGSLILGAPGAARPHGSPRARRRSAARRVSRGKMKPCRAGVHSRQPLGLGLATLRFSTLETRRDSRGAEHRRAGTPSRVSCRRWRGRTCAQPRLFPEVPVRDWRLSHVPPGGASLCSACRGTGSAGEGGALPCPALSLQLLITALRFLALISSRLRTTPSP